jgi:CBS domain-containing protein
MSRGVVVGAPETPINDAARTMTERRSRSLVVVEHSGKAVGILTGYDLLGAPAPRRRRGERGRAGARAHLDVRITRAIPERLPTVIDSPISSGCSLLRCPVAIDACALLEPRTELKRVVLN